MPHDAPLWNSEAEVSHRDCAATDDNDDWNQGPEGQMPEEVPAGEDAEAYEGTSLHGIIWMCT